MSTIRNIEKELIYGPVGFLFLLLSIAGIGFILDCLLAQHNGLVGGDFSYFFPKLLQGKFFVDQQGFSLPMYSPYDCGGTPFFANPQSMFYSLPQILTLYTDTWSAIRFTVLIFFSLQALGAYLLLRVSFRCSPIAAWMGGIIYATNTYFIVRMMGGQLSYHSVALIPFLAFFLLSPFISNLIAASAVGFIGAYSVYSGAYSSIILSLFALLFTGIIYLFTLEPDGDVRLSVKRVFARGAIGALIAVALSLPKLYLAAALLRQFPHKFGLDTVSDSYDLIAMIAGQLFFFGAYRPFPQYGFGEYGATISPVALLGIWSLFRTRQPIRAKLSQCWLLIGGGLVVLFWLFLVGGRAPASTVLSMIGLEAIRLNIRFTGAMMLPIVILASLGFSRIVVKSEKIGLMLLVSLGCLVQLLILSAPRLMLETHTVSLAEMQKSENSFSPIGTDRGPSAVVSSRFLSYAEALYSRSANSQCYEPLFFGERVPGTNLRDGVVNTTDVEGFNLLNPSCFLFPSHFNCVPGDRIASSDGEFLHDLLSFKNPQQEMPRQFQVMKLISILTLIIVLVFICYSAFLSVQRLFKKTNS